MPRELAHTAEPVLTELFAGDPLTRVLVERRRNERRRPRGRRADATTASCESSAERRRIHSTHGRRVGERRAALEPVPAPVSLPACALAYAERLRFVERRAPSAQQLEDLETARLVISLQAGAPGAFDLLYERYIARVYGYMRIALRDPHEAEDAAHEVFLKMLQALPVYEVRDVPFRVWLFRVARNYTINHLQRLGRMEVTEPEEVNRRLEDGHDGTHGEALLGLDDTALLRMVERLPVAQRQVIVLRYVMGFDVTEVAQILDRSPNGVSQLQRRAFEMLRARLVASGEHAAPRETAGVRMAMRMRVRGAVISRARALALVGRC